MYAHKSQISIYFTSDPVTEQQLNQKWPQILQVKTHNIDNNVLKNCKNFD